MKNPTTSQILDHIDRAQRVAAGAPLHTRDLPLGGRAKITAALDEVVELVSDLHTQQVAANISEAVSSRSYGKGSGTAEISSAHEAAQRALEAGKTVEEATESARKAARKARDFYYDVQA